MTPETWNENHDRPAWVRAHRATLRDLGFEPPTSLSRLADWAQAHAEDVAESLADQTDADDTTDDIGGDD